MAEQDLRLGMLNTLLTTPHRALGLSWFVHAGLIGKDPRFYVRLAAWYNDHGDVRDHKELFIVALVLSEFPGHRDVGLAMLRELPPYQVTRVVDFISGRKEDVKVRVGVEAKGKKAKEAAKAAGLEQRVETLVDDFGLFRNVPRSVKTEVARYLREREADPAWFDATVMNARKAVKRLYALLHVKPAERAQAILFDEKPPEDSRLYALKLLAAAPSDEARADLIRRLELPFRVAAGLVGAKPSPAVLGALVERMSAQELINSLGQLRKKGAFDDAALKAAIEAKLESAQTAGRVSALKATEAVKAAGLSADVVQKLEQVADTQLKAKGRINRPTALFIDKSGSMEVAIELGKRIGAMLAGVCAAGLHVYAFDTIAYPIEAVGDSLSDWERALAGITAGGGTSCGVALEALRRKALAVEQIVIVTDEGENAAPLFAETLQRYRTELVVDPNVCIVKTPGATTHMEEQLRKAGLTCDTFQFAGDYYSLPNLVPLLARPSKMELLMEIMEYPLPRRKLA